MNSGLIPNEALNEDNIPPADADWGLIGSFALSFNGYEKAGSFAACGEINNRAEREYQTRGTVPDTLDELRICLFFEQRRWRHYGYAPDEKGMRFIRALLVKIRDLALQGE
jgi:hypothetical protein